MNIYVVSRLYTDNTSIVMNAFVNLDEAEEFANKQQKHVEFMCGKFDDDDDCDVECITITRTQLNGMD